MNRLLKRLKKHRIYLILGGIGSGKSYISRSIMNGKMEIECLCSDEYKCKLFNVIDADDNMIKKAYRCSDELLFYRIEKLCSEGMDFILEFCPTNRNKFETIKYYSRLYNYNIISYFIATDDVKTNIQRVLDREKQGGDHVSEEKVKSRYKSVFNSVLETLSISNSTCFIDNSTDTPKIVAVQKKNKFYVIDSKCDWFKKQIKQKLNNQKG